MSVQDEILKRIKEEIANDPRKLGYAGKTQEQQMNILNSAYFIVVSSEIIQAPPITQILAGIESTPNAVDVKLVSDSVLFIATPIEEK